MNNLLLSVQMWCVIVCILGTCRINSLPNSNEIEEQIAVADGNKLKRQDWILLFDFAQSARAQKCDFYADWFDLKLFV